VDIELRAKGGIRLNPALRTHVERRLRFALDRLARRVRSVRVLLEDVNGPRGGDDVRCLVLARISGGGHVVVQETRRDPFAAVARASDRIGHGLARRLGRLRKRRRG